VRIDVTPELLATIIFLITYAGIALGRIPGLMLDRTGVALLGAIAMLSTRVLNEGEAFEAIHLPTILLLYSLMILSAQFTLAGFYAEAGRKLTRVMQRPEIFLLLLMLTSGVFSALIINDVVCLAFTPIVCACILQSSLNPVPFLIGLACASNIGSASTIIGNPQNMLIGQVGNLKFGEFLWWCAPPSIISLFVAYVIILWAYRNNWTRKAAATDRMAEESLDYDAHQSRKALILLVVLIVLFFTGIPRELSALSVAGIALCSRRMATKSLLGRINWHLITLFCALFIVIEGVVKFGIPQTGVQILASWGLDVNSRLGLSLITLIGSNVFSNVPAVMLLLKNVDLHLTSNLYIMALVSTYAGNLITIGSFANLIVIEQAKPYKIDVGFTSHAKVGIPVTLASILVALLWAAIIT
jgi:Na+/H+ antiporter NhaD/arsenite permease-like protein